MIKINLIAQPKKFKIPVVMGLDIRMFNFKMLLIVWALSFVPDLIKTFYFDLEQKNVLTKIQFHKTQIKRYRKILKKNEKVKRKIEAFDRQAKKLKERESQVLQIIKNRTNPFKILVKMAKSTPDKLWTTTIKIEKNDLLIDGYAINYRSIGNFIDALNESIFFSKSLQLKKTESVREVFNRQEFRLERFKIVGKIVRFD